MKKGIYTLIGFLLFLFGTLSLVLLTVGVQLYFLTWLDAFGGLVGFLLRLLMIISGISIVFLVRSGEQTHEEFFEN